MSVGEWAVPKKEKMRMMILYVLDRLERRGRGFAERSLWVRIAVRRYNGERRKRLL